MITLLTGLVAHAIAIGFLGFLAYSIASVPLWVVILVGLALMICDFLNSMRTGEYTG